MPAVYQSGGLRFLYPDNWILGDEDAHALPRTITVSAPSGAFWSVDIHPFSVDPEELLEQVVAAMRAEYADLEVESAEETIGEQASLGHDLLFSCLDFIVRSQLRALRFGHATYLLTYQAEDRDFTALDRVFRAITTSLLADHLEAPGRRSES